LEENLENNIFIDSIRKPIIRAKPLHRSMGAECRKYPYTPHSTQFSIYTTSITRDISATCRVRYVLNACGSIRMVPKKAAKYPIISTNKGFMKF
jgi:hypothetical protein